MVLVSLRHSFSTGSWTARSRLPSQNPGTIRRPANVKGLVVLSGLRGLRTVGRWHSELDGWVTMACQCPLPAFFTSVLVIVCHVTVFRLPGHTLTQLLTASGGGECGKTQLCFSTLQTHSLFINKDFYYLFTLPSSNEIHRSCNLCTSTQHFYSFFYNFFNF